MMFEIFLIICGLIIGLGAVTVIDIHGFLGQKSKYWTEATTRTHKVTKPLIWIGTIVYFIGAILFYSRLHSFLVLPITGMFILMTVNGLFLSFYVSPRLLKREQEGKASELLDSSMQIKIKISFICSFLLWWSQVILFAYKISGN